MATFRTTEPAGSAGDPPAGCERSTSEGDSGPAGSDSADEVHIPAVAGSGRTISQLLDEAPRSGFHLRAVVVSGVGFFTDAYDLFVISTVAVLVKAQWHLSTSQTSWVTASAILAAFVGAVAFGRVADLIGRKKVYGTVAGIMIVGALGSAAAPGFWWLLGFRFLLGIGIGGDYPVSAVLMSEYANRRDRGRLVGLVFSMQALGLVVGPFAAIALLGTGVDARLTWRLLLALGAVPAAAVIYLRAKMPESPRYQSRVQGADQRALAELTSYSNGVISSSQTVPEMTPRMRIRDLATDPRSLRLLIGTAGSWFLFDYAYYGNTLSLPEILASVDRAASMTARLGMSLALFVLFAVPGYLLAIFWMDRFGHRRLQMTGFAAMAVAFLGLAEIGVLTQVTWLFISVFGLSYFFVEFGPNTTTFVLPAEVFPTSVRTTGHGIASGVGKLGAFIGALVVPILQSAVGLHGMLLLAAAASASGCLSTLLVPEAGRRSLEEVSGETMASAGSSTMARRPAPYGRSPNGSTDRSGTLSPGWLAVAPVRSPHGGDSES